MNLCSVRFSLLAKFSSKKDGKPKRKRKEKILWRSQASTWAGRQLLPAAAWPRPSRRCRPSGCWGPSARYHALSGSFQPINESLGQLIFVNRVLSSEIQTHFASIEINNLRFFQSFCWSNSNELIFKSSKYSIHTQKYLMTILENLNCKHELWQVAFKQGKTR